MTIKTQPCKTCPTEIVVRPNALYCETCKAKIRKITAQKAHERQTIKRQEQRSAKLENPPSRKFQTSSDADVLHWVRHFIHKVCDVGENGPVIHYQPGSSEFERVAAMYN